MSLDFVQGSASILVSIVKVLSSGDIDFNTGCRHPFWALTFGVHTGAPRGAQGPIRVPQYPFPQFSHFNLRLCFPLRVPFNSQRISPQAPKNDPCNRSHINDDLSKLTSVTV